MRKTILFPTILAILLTACNAPTSTKQEIVIDLQQKGAPISQNMYGVFFEEINHAGDGGIYAELIKNRSFEDLETPDGYKIVKDRLFPKQKVNHMTGKINSNTSFKWTTEEIPGWKLNVDDTKANLMLSKENPLFPLAPNNLQINIREASSPILLINEGFWGMNIQKGEKYLLRSIIRPNTEYKGKIIAKLLSSKGEVIGSAEIDCKDANKWNDSKTSIKATGSDPKAQFAFELEGKGLISFDYVSLFPENTFMKRTNGMRYDVAQLVSDLKPKFVRWPGGCVVEGITTENRYEWKRTLGDPAGRSGEYSTWGYRCSYGFGFHELLQFCEDIKADAMYVCSVGIGCQFRMGDASEETEIQFYLQDCLDAIEYAIGDTTTLWGARRAENGHTAAFPLKYIEIGNENWGDEYDKRFDIFYKAIKAQYPQLTLISNHGLFRLDGIGKSEKTDMIDPHWYESPDFFLNNTNIFDNYERGQHTVYVGEYACNKGVGSGNMTAALSEAAFITGMERNGDLVTMTSYAPLFENKNDRNWPVNLIWIDNDQVIGRSSYYVQKMSSENLPTYNIKSNIYTTEPVLKPTKEGQVGVGSWKTQVEYKDIKVSANSRHFKLDLDKFTSESGSWEMKDSVASQTSLEEMTKRILKQYIGTGFILELKARKITGDEGFLIYFGMSDDGTTGHLFNIGGWNNTQTAAQTINEGRTSTTIATVPHSIEANRWYNIKVESTALKTDLYVDGTLILTYKPEESPLQFFATGYDEVNKEIIIKAVNASDKTFEANFKLENAQNIAKEGKVITLSAASGEDENSFIEPNKISPIETTFKNFSSDFDYSLQPYSYTILRIKSDSK